MPIVSTQVHNLMHNNCRQYEQEYLAYIIVTRFAKRCIVYTSKFSGLLTHKIFQECQMDKKLSRLQNHYSCIFPKKISTLYTNLYGSPNTQNRMCKPCNFFQIQSQLYFDVFCLQTYWGSKKVVVMIARHCGTLVLLCH